MTYLLSGGEDPHWEPYHKSCAPCLVDYDAVVKLETAEEEEAHVLQMSGMGRWVGMERKHSYRVGAREKRKEFYSLLDCQLLVSLFRMYEMDFVLFEYNFGEFLANIDKQCNDFVE